MEKENNTLHARETIALYNGRRPADVEAPEKADLGIQDLNSLRGKMSTLAQRAVGLCKKTTGDTPGILKKYEDWDKDRQMMQCEKNKVPVMAEVIDPSIPLTVFISKEFTNYERENKRGTKNEEWLKFDLVKWAPEGSASLMDSYKSFWERPYAERKDEQVANMHFIVKDGQFNLIDRFVDPKFRSQKIGDLMLSDLSESYIKESSMDHVKTGCESFVHTAQVDVISWLLRHDYLPQTSEDSKRVQAILSGDENLCLGENYYVFPNTVPEQDRTVRNRDNAFSVNLVKKIEPTNEQNAESSRRAVMDILPLKK